MSGKSSVSSAVFALIHSFELFCCMFSELSSTLESFRSLTFLCLSARSIEGRNASQTKSPNHPAQPKKKRNTKGGTSHEPPNSPSKSGGGNTGGAGQDPEDPNHKGGTRPKEPERGRDKEKRKKGQGKGHEPKQKGTQAT